MRIESSNLEMYASHTYCERNERQEKLRLWLDAAQSDAENQSPSSMSSINAKGYILDLQGSTAALQPSQRTEDTYLVELQDVKTEDELKLAIIVHMLKALTGKEMKIKRFRLPNDCADYACPKQQTVPTTTEEQNRQGWGLEYDYHELYQESEKMTFSVTGTVKTTDGKEFDLSAELSLSREFVYEYSLSVRAGDARLVDPLVINFGGSFAELTDNKFSFDLDADGREELISTIGSNSGFLAIDRNGDGVINDGSELLGPNSGDGFAELASYDEDGNSWLDENDIVFNNLLIWSKDARGTDSLFTLKQKDIGAIYLNQVITPFTVTNTANDVKGQVKSSGIYLTENGNTGTLQNIDFAV